MKVMALMALSNLFVLEQTTCSYLHAVLCLMTLGTRCKRTLEADLNRPGSTHQSTTSVNSLGDKSGVQEVRSYVKDQAAGASGTGPMASAAKAASSCSSAAGASSWLRCPQPGSTRKRLSCRRPHSAAARCGVTTLHARPVSPDHQL